MIKSQVGAFNGSANMEHYNGKHSEVNGGSNHDASAKVSTSDLKKPKGIFTRISQAIIWGLESCFYRVGLFVGEFPVLSIVIPVMMCLLCGLGMKTFDSSPDQTKLWVPSAARVVTEKEWIDKTFPQETRFVAVMVADKNVLTPRVMKALYDYYEESKRISIKGTRFRQLCVRLGDKCYVSSLLELWGYDKQTILSLTTEDILKKINTTSTLPISRVKVTTLLGGDLEYKNGSIVGAEATEINWIMKKENAKAEIYETKMIRMALKGHKNISDTYVYATRSFDDEGYGAVNSDAKLLTAGFSIVLVFIMLSLGKFNLLEQKIYLSITGMLCVGLSVLVAFGFCTALSVVYSPIHAILPFLLLGIGVDDMFVVVEVWKNLTPEEDKLSIPHKIATTLSHAGVSITVTSITDIVAFGIGATTVIPALSSFCIYATIGILALFGLVSTTFAGVLALDERRRLQRRDACITCFVHSETYKPNQCSQGKSLLQTAFTRFYGPLITKKAGKVVIILLALGMTGTGFWRFMKMKTNFDLINYIPGDSYAYAYAKTKKEYFNREGVDTTVYCGGFDYFKYQHNMDKMFEGLSHSKYIQPGTIVDWYNAFNRSVGKNFSNSDEYNKAVWKFTKSGNGSRFASFVKFNSTEEPVSIVATKFTLTHVLQSGSDGDLAAMDNIREIIDSCGLPTFSGDDMPTTMCFALAREYLTFETIKVLLRELYRNLGLAAAAVLLVTIVLVANVWTSFLVFICVLFTVVDVGGVLEIWGTTIDTASSILLTISMGLAVDYSAHVGHTFMTVRGNRDERAILTLKKIGPAVFNGGISTMLAFVLLADSASYGFQLFFRVFMSVVVFGLFHGLAFLPVLLSLVGPPPYSQEPVETTDDPDYAVAIVNNEDGAKRHNDASVQNHSEPYHFGYDGPQKFDSPDDVESKSWSSCKPVITTVEAEVSKKYLETKSPGEMSAFKSVIGVKGEVPVRIRDLHRPLGLAVSKSDTIANTHL